MGSTRKLTTLLAALLALVAIAPAPAAQAAGTKPYMYPPTAHPLGHTYTQWEVSLFQWWASIPVPQNPWLDKSGSHCAVGQSGPAWYLLNGTVNGTVVRNCTVPAGKGLIIDNGLGECSTAENNLTTYAALRACVNGYPKVTEDYVTVDGVHLNLLTRYNFWTPLFSFNYPADNILSTPSGGQVPGPGTTKAVGEACIVILAPLVPGRHTVELFDTSPAEHWTGHVIYHLTVGG